MSTVATIHGRCAYQDAMETITGGPAFGHPIDTGFISTHRLVETIISYEVLLVVIILAGVEYK